MYCVIFFLPLSFLLILSSDEDLDLIFSRFGNILSCEVIRDKRTGDSLQYAFIEFENQKDCEQAYFKMQGVLIDDHRIHVDFSQSVSPHFITSVSAVLTISKRCPNYLIPGGMLRTQNVQDRVVDLVESLILRRSGSTERWT